MDEIVHLRMSGAVVKSVLRMNRFSVDSDRNNLAMHNTSHEYGAVLLKLIGTLEKKKNFFRP